MAGIWYLRSPDAMERYVKPLPEFTRDLGGVMGAYLSVEQMVFREKPSRNNSEGLYLFGQAAWSPHLWDVAYQGTLGVLYQGLIPYRPHDVLGLGITVAGFSEQLSMPMSMDGEVNNGGWEMTGREVLIVIFYKRRWSRFLTLQNGFQYIINPRGITRPQNLLRQKSVLAYSLQLELHF